MKRLEERADEMRIESLEPGEQAEEGSSRTSTSTSAALEVHEDDAKPGEHEHGHAHAPAQPMTTWRPKRSMEECARLLTAPGTMHEMEHALINGRILRVYKNLPKVRTPHRISCSQQFADVPSSSRGR